MATLSDVANITVSKNRDETINGNIMFNGWVNSNHRNANSVFYGYDGSDYSLVGWKREGSGIEIFGSESANCARWLRLRSSDDSTYWNDLDVRNDGVFFNGQHIVRLVEAWADGVNWYRKYSDGWIEQGGKASMPSTECTVTFHTAFANTNYMILGASAGSTNTLNVEFKNKSTSSVVFDYSGTTTGNFYWYACGY